MSTGIEPLLTREEAADILNMSVSWVRAQIRHGRLRAKKLGKLVRIEPQDLRDFIQTLDWAVAKNVGTPYIPGLFASDKAKSERLKSDGLNRK
jgi:excisionase family DNA binding protein